MIRVVIDTNILVSALLQPESLPAAVLMLTISGEVQLCVSDAVFAEYDEVIRRPFLRLPLDFIDSTLLSIRKLVIGSSHVFVSRNAPTPTTTFSSSVPKRLKRITSSPAIDVTFPSDGRRPK